MTTFAAALKNEIRRLARKEVKAQTQPTSKAVARYRREIAQLKRRIEQQDKLIKSLGRQEGSQVASHELNGSDDGNRFSARSVRAQRRRTGLSAADYAKLVGVSALTIYNWEHSKSRPRRQQLQALVAVRGIGRREALKRIESLAANAKRTRGTARGRRK